MYPGQASNYYRPITSTEAIVMTRGLPTKKVYVRGDHGRLYADVREYKKYLHLVTGVNRTGLHVALKTTDKKLAMRRYMDLVHRLEKARQNVIDGVAQPA